MVEYETAKEKLTTTIGVLNWTELSRDLNHDRSFDKWELTSTAYTETGEEVILKVSSESDELNCYSVWVGSESEFSIPLE